MSVMAAEIASIPDVVETQLSDGLPVYLEAGRRLAALDPPVVMTGARGSSDHAAVYFKYLAEILTGCPVASVGPSIGSIYNAPLRLTGGAILSISQSGASPDLVALTETARSGGALTMALVNDTSAPLARASDLVLPILAGPEHAVAATKTCIGSFVALAAVVAGWTGDRSIRQGLQRLPAHLDAALACDWTRALPVLAAADSLYVMSRGPGFAVAGEAALKMKECCRLHAEAVSAAEVRHGPIALAGPGFCALAFVGRDAGGRSTAESLAALREAGAPGFLASAEPSGTGGLPTVASDHPLLDPICQLASFYRFVEQLAGARGHNPDRPALLRKVTETL